MSDKTVIYFHGYGSSPNTDKVKLLKEQFHTVLAFPIDVDPDVSIPYLEKQIDNFLVSNINSQSEIIFVGTSLGAWYAGRMASLFGVRCVLINPCYSQHAVKIDLGIPEEIKAKYGELGFSYPYNAQFFIAEDDEVINFEEFKDNVKKITWVENAGHRFNGPEFQQVIEYIKNLE